MELKYNKIFIRNANKEDCEILAKWWNDGSVMAHAGFPNGLGTNANEIAKQIHSDSDSTKRRLIIEYDNLLIGEMSYYILDNDIVEIGIKICNSDYHEKGLGRVILSMLIRELFNRGHKKIILDTDLNNKRAQHVYEKLGFKQTAIKIDSWKDQLGNLCSSVNYELVENDFNDYKQNQL